MRCLALAQAWQDAGGEAIFAMAQVTPAIEARLLRENVEVIALSVEPGNVSDAAQITSLARNRRADWIAVDGYQFGSSYQSCLKEAGLKVLFVDDNGHAQHYSANFVLNQNAHANEAFYQKRDPNTMLLLGLRYALLRREFNMWRAWKRKIPDVGMRILVTMGGSDPDNVTSHVLASLKGLSVAGVETKVVVGGSNPHRLSVEKLAAEMGKSIQVLENVSNMAELIAWADVAVAGAGTTSAELCFLGLPALLVIIAENQRPSSEELDRLGVAINLGTGLRIDGNCFANRLTEALSSKDVRQEISMRGRALVDGQGAARVVRALLAEVMEMRFATSADCKLLWQLANDPVVRSSSFSHEPIPWDAHVRWFEGRMADPRCRIFVSESKGALIGQVRVEWTADLEGEIHMSVAPDFRGAGVGKQLIDKAVREVFSSAGLSRVHAYILPENPASVGAFKSAGFQMVGKTVMKKDRALHYVRVREGAITEVCGEGAK